MKENELIYTENLRDAYASGSVCGGSAAGKTVLIIGGYGGVGISCACRFALEGARVILAGRKEDKLHLAETYVRRKKEDAEVTGIQLDISSDESIQAFVCHIREQGIRFDFMIQCIGYGSEIDVGGHFLVVSDEYYRQILRINYEGIVKLTDLIFDDFVSWGGSAVVFVGSTAALQRKYQFAPYGIAKTALENYVKCLSKRSRQISVSIVEPGGIATPLVGRGSGSLINTNGNILKRFILPEEIAAYIAFSCADGIAPFLNGSAVELSACEPPFCQNNIALYRINIDRSIYPEWNQHGFSGSSLGEFVRLQGDLSADLHQLAGNELQKEGCGLRKELGNPAHIVICKETGNMEDVHALYRMLQSDCVECIDASLECALTVCMRGKGVDESSTISLEAASRMIEGLGEKMARYGIYINGASVSPDVSWEILSHFGAFLNSKYGRILVGQVLRIFRREYSECF